MILKIQDLNNLKIKVIELNEDTTLTQFYVSENMIKKHKWGHQWRNPHGTSWRSPAEKRWNRVWRQVWKVYWRRWKDNWFSFISISLFVNQKDTGIFSKWKTPFQYYLYFCRNYVKTFKLVKVFLSLTKKNMSANQSRIIKFSGEKTLKF